MYAAKKDSAIQRAVLFIIKQIKENRTRFFTIIGFSIGLVFMGIFIFSRIQSLNVTASERLSFAYYYLSAGDVPQAVTYLDEIISGFPNTPSSYQARMIRADVYVEEGAYDEALNLLTEAYLKGKPQEFRPLAAARIINLYDRKGDYQLAVMNANEFINKYKDHYFSKDIYINLARYYLVLDSLDDAKRVLSEILVTFPGSNEAAAAEEMLETIE